MSDRPVPASVDVAPDCVVDCCDDPAIYAGAYRLGGRKIILDFCERHFDETADDALKVDGEPRTLGPPPPPPSSSQAYVRRRAWWVDVGVLLMVGGVVVAFVVTLF